LPLLSRLFDPRLVLLALASLASIACDSGPVTVIDPEDPGSPPPGAPTPDPPADPPPPAGSGQPRVLSIVEPVITLSPGDEQAIEFRFLDVGGGVVEVQPGPDWSSDAPDRATVGADGRVRAGDALGLAWVHARALGLRDSVAIWVQRREGEPSDFEITLFYAEGVPEWWPPALEEAAERWEKVIRGALPAVLVSGRPNVCEFLSPPPAAFMAGQEDGVRLFVQVSDRFPEGTFVGAVGGTCSHRGLPFPTTVLGALSLNADKFEAGIPPDLEYLAHHEMGHALGLVGQVQGQQPPWLDAGSGTYRGRLGLYGHSLDIHRTVNELSFADGGHWPFEELMGIFRGTHIGHATVGALMDLGYPAAWYGAGPVAD
jgi:hypothetical protein